LQEAITLYGPPRAPFTEKCRRALLLKGVAFELREPAGREDYARWSPKTGMLPVLAIGQEWISDSTDILLHLDARFPEPPLLAPDPKVAAQQRSLEDWIDETCLWHFQRWLRLEERNPPREAPQGRSSPLRRLGAWLRAGGTWERPETGLLREIDQRLGDLVNLLGTRRFFYADRISMADLAAYGMLHTLRADAIPGSARLLAGRPLLVELMRSIEEQTGG
jgi:glutathione S-transferase